LVHILEAVFNRRELRGKIYWGEEFRLKAVPYFEWGMAGCTVSPYIVGKFCKREEMCPIILLIIAEDSEELFNFLVDSFSFTIGLRVKDGGKGLINFEFVPCFTHYFGCKLWSSV
jgi:hypothetical protein